MGLCGTILYLFFLHQLHQYVQRFLMNIEVIPHVPHLPVQLHVALLQYPAHANTHTYTSVVEAATHKPVCLVDEHGQVAELVDERADKCQLVGSGRVNGAEGAQGVVQFVLLLELVYNQLGFEGHAGKQHQNQQGIVVAYSVT